MIPHFINIDLFIDTNLLKSPTFVAGPIASQCPDGVNPDYPNLCAAVE